ncbi:hypothetical protein FB45DRAFT_1084947 [Roridomyces roridus]|uniref:DUF6533 domain-containing protein n=1 Tax=Roridomyces roridus TaxID=1738132 RepID=A0AAD7BNG4_9AGAR|nr:hypothetical protein FB45DRAFT_1084947 [Roridomyces roridus]
MDLSVAGDSGDLSYATFTSDHRILRYFFLAGLTILVYDHILTLGMEVKYIWASKLRPGTCWFLAVRYLGLVASLLQLPYFFSRLDHAIEMIGFRKTDSGATATVRSPHSIADNLSILVPSFVIRQKEGAGVLAPMQPRSREGERENEGRRLCRCVPEACRQRTGHTEHTGVLIPIPPLLVQDERNMIQEASQCDGVPEHEQPNRYNSAPNRRRCSSSSSEGPRRARPAKLENCSSRDRTRKQQAGHEGRERESRVWVVLSAFYLYPYLLRLVVEPGGANSVELQSAAGPEDSSQRSQRGGLRMRWAYRAGWGWSMQDTGLGMEEIRELGSCLKLQWLWDFPLIVHEILIEASMALRVIAMYGFDKWVFFHQWW